MSVPLLRLYDGFAHTSPDLRGAVRDLQAVLRRHDRAVAIDGLFDRGTEQAVRAFPSPGTTGPRPVRARDTRRRGRTDAGPFTRETPGESVSAACPAR